MKTSKVIGFTLLLLIISLVAVFLIERRQASTSQIIRYGISPFQDTAMPKVAEGMGLFKNHGLKVELVTVGWEDIIPSLASASPTVDVAIGSINTFLPRAENIDVTGGGDVVVYYPLYVFKGASLMINGDSGIKPLSDLLVEYPNDRARAVREAMQQLKGRKVGVPNGTPYEQMLLAALAEAGMTTKDIDLRYVDLANALYAFKSGDVDVIGAGVTQRTEAARSGAKVFLDMESFGFAEIVCLVTTRHFADSHPKELTELLKVWFDSTDRLLANIDGNSAYVLDYLAKNASTKYSLDEYKAALQFQVFPRSEEEAKALMLEPTGKFYWKRTWEIVNQYLVSKGEVKRPIPSDYFLGERVDAELEQK